MNTLVLNSTYSRVYETLKTVLRLYKCEEIISDKLQGQIRARKKSNLNNRTEVINVLINKKTKQTTGINITVSQDGESEAKNIALSELHKDEICELLQKNL